MSADEQWMIIRNNSCFLLKRNHEQFTRNEPNNLKNKNRFRFNGLVHSKTVGIHEAKNGNGVVLKTKKWRYPNKPRRMYNSVQLSKNPRKILRSIRRTICKNGYRRDLKMAALRRASAIIKSQRQKRKQK